MIDVVRISRPVQKQLPRLPRHIVRNLMAWVKLVELQGLEETRKVPGYHDELLKGAREGQRSIRLSRAYRAFYTIHEDDADDLVIEFVLIEELNKHEY